MYYGNVSKSNKLVFRVLKILITHFNDYLKRIKKNFREFKSKLPLRIKVKRKSSKTDNIKVFLKK